MVAADYDAAKRRPFKRNISAARLSCKRLVASDLPLQRWALGEALRVGDELGQLGEQLELHAPAKTGADDDVGSA